jgi:simple sugar transport system ATP-binding protein
MLRQKERGAGILLVSDDLDEVFLLSDRVIVLYEGRIMGEMSAKSLDRDRIGLWMSGVAS